MPTALPIERPGGLLVEVTDGPADYNAANYRLSPFYDLAKVSLNRLAWAHAKDLAPYDATAVSLSPGWLRSEIMLEAYRVTEETWREAPGDRAPLRHLRDPARARWTGQSLSSGGLAQVYGFTDVDGSRPDAWRYMVEVQDAGKSADVMGYR